MVAADTLEALGIQRGQYVVKVNNRKILDGVLESIGYSRPTATCNATRLDRPARDRQARSAWPLKACARFSGKGRKDESGDFTKGAELSSEQIEIVTRFRHRRRQHRARQGRPRRLVPILSSRASSVATGVAASFRRSDEFVDAANFGADRVIFDPSVVRGLEYYTGPVFEAELIAPIVDDRGQLDQARLGGERRPL